MIKLRHGIRAQGIVAFLLIAIATGARVAPSHAQSLPSRLSDTDFWKLVTEFSEPDGVFLSENFLSNEAGFQYVIPELQRTLPTKGVYIGVGPEQNFTYIAALQPRMAFIVDIRRQAMLQHLVYKAVFEMADNRAEFLSLLFARKRPDGLNDRSTPDQLFVAFDSVPPDSAMFARNVASVIHRLTKQHGFTLDEKDIDGIRHVMDVIFTYGPALNYGSSAGAPISSLRLYVPMKDSGTRIVRDSSLVITIPPLTRSSAGTGVFGRVDYSSLMAQTDAAGIQRSFLASENNFRTVKELESRNLLVPVVGNFAGPKALRSVGQYVRDHSATVNAFYVSNVEQYLFQNTSDWNAFYQNVATLPIDNNSTFIRSLSGGGFWAPTSPNGTRLTSALGSIANLLAAFAAGEISGYSSLIALSHQ